MSLLFRIQSILREPRPVLFRRSHLPIAIIFVVTLFAMSFVASCTGQQETPQLATTVYSVPAATSEATLAIETAHTTTHATVEVAVTPSRSTPVLPKITRLAPLATEVLTPTRTSAPFATSTLAPAQPPEPAATSTPAQTPIPTQTPEPGATFTPIDKQISVAKRVCDPTKSVGSWDRIAGPPHPPPGDVRLEFRNLKWRAFTDVSPADQFIVEIPLLDGTVVLAVTGGFQNDFVVTEIVDPTQPHPLLSDETPPVPARYVTAEFRQSIGGYFGEESVPNFTYDFDIATEAAELPKIDYWTNGGFPTTVTRLNTDYGSIESPITIIFLDRVPELRIVVNKQNEDSTETFYIDLPFPEKHALPCLDDGSTHSFIEAAKTSRWRPAPLGETVLYDGTVTIRVLDSYRSDQHPFRDSQTKEEHLEYVSATLEISAENTETLQDILEIDDFFILSDGFVVDTDLGGSWMGIDWNANHVGEAFVMTYFGIATKNASSRTLAFHPAAVSTNTAYLSLDDSVELDFPTTPFIVGGETETNLDFGEGQGGFIEAMQSLTRDQKLEAFRSVTNEEVEALLVTPVVCAFQLAKTTDDDADFVADTSHTLSNSSIGAKFPHFMQNVGDTHTYCSDLFPPQTHPMLLKELFFGPVGLRFRCAATDEVTKSDAAFITRLGEVIFDLWGENAPRNIDTFEHESELCKWAYYEGVPALHSQFPELASE